MTSTQDKRPQDSAVESRYLVMPMDAGLRQFPACFLKEDLSRRIRSGQTLPGEAVEVQEKELCRAYATYSGETKLVALLKFDPSAEAWQPHKVFHPL